MKRSFTEKPFEELMQKNFQPRPNNPSHTWPLNATIEDGPCNHEEINWRKHGKKAVGTLGLKLCEFCKTRNLKSIPDRSNCYVVMAGHDKVADAGRATTCRRKFKAPSLQRKGTKTGRHTENMGFDGKTFWKPQTKTTSSLVLTTPWNTRPPNARIDDGPCNQEEINWGKFEKTIQVKTFGNMQDQS